MRIQTQRDIDRQERRRQEMRAEIRQVNADRASMASDLVTARKSIDMWRDRALQARDRALKAEEACRRLAAENERLRRQLPKPAAEPAKKETDPVEKETK